MDINSIIMKKIIESIDISDYKNQIEDAIAEYFGSNHFKENVTEALADSSLAWNIGQEVSEKISKQIKKLNISITFKG